MIDTIVERFFGALKWCIALCLVGMVVLVFGNVVLRYGFNSGLTASEELSRWLFVWLTFLGAVVAMREHAHLGVDTLVRRLPLAGRRACFVASHGLMLYVTWLILQGSWVQVGINWTARSPGTGLSVALFYASGVVFGVLAGLILLADLARALAGRMSAEELVAVRESEEQEEFEALQRALERERLASESSAAGAAAAGAGAVSAAAAAAAIVTTAASTREAA